MDTSPYIPTPIPVVDPLNELPVFNLTDRWVDGDVLWLIDVDRRKSYPLQDDPNNGTTLGNLAGAGAVATVVKSDNDITFRNKGLAFNGDAGNYIKIGATNAAFLLNAMGNPDVLYTVWFRREDNNAYGSYPVIMGRTRGLSYDAPTQEFTLNLGADGKSLLVSFSNGTEVVSVFLAPGAPVNEFLALVGTSVQVCFGVEGGFVLLFVNGVLKATSSTAFTKPYNNYNTVPIQIGEGYSGSSGFKGVFHRAGMSKLTGAKTAAQKAIEDFNTNYARFNP